MKLYFDSLTTLKVIHAESPIVIFFGTYGITVIELITLHIGFDDLIGKGV